MLAVVTLILGALTPEYSHRSQVISELAAQGTRYGVLMSAAIVTFGLLLIGFAPAMFVAHQPGASAAVSALLIAGGGLALIIAGLFRCDPGCSLESISPGMATHIWSAFAASWLLALAPLGLAVRLPATPSGHRYYAASLLAGLGMVIMLFVTMAAGPRDPSIGWLQRLSLTILAAWLIASALRVQRAIRTRHREG